MCLQLATDCRLLTLVILLVSLYCFYIAGVHISYTRVSIAYHSPSIAFIWTVSIAYRRVYIAYSSRSIAFT